MKAQRINDHLDVIDVAQALEQYAKRLDLEGRERRARATQDAGPGYTRGYWKGSGIQMQRTARRLLAMARHVKATAGIRVVVEPETLEPAGMVWL